jgi:hypothetical protein
MKEERIQDIVMRKDCQGIISNFIPCIFELHLQAVEICILLLVLLQLIFSSFQSKKIRLHVTCDT